MNRIILLGLVGFFLSVQALGLGTRGSTDALSTLKNNQELAGFRVASLYSGPGGRIVGAKFWHIATGAPVYFLQIETVPQVFTWIDTPADSNKGLPHSLEHLLAGRGTTGRYYSLLANMRLSQTEAATSRDFNFYGLSSGAGMDGFFELFHALLDALYHPDFTDGEAGREFYHVGVAADPVTKRRTLTEQGAVYDEMQTREGRFTYYFELNKRLFGEENPFGFDTGGVPKEMRGVTPEQIRRFHAQHYRLGPTAGFIFVLDPKESLSAFLQKISNEFRQFSSPSLASPPPIPLPGQPKYPIHSSEDKKPTIFPFAGASETSPGFIHFAWKPVRTESLVQLKLLELLSRGLAGGEGSLLQQSIVDSKTRATNSGATGVDSTLFLENSPYFPVVIVEISGIPGNRISVSKIEELGSMVLSKIREISQYPDHSEDLATFNLLIASYAKGLRRSQDIWIQNTPGFGSREFKTDWKSHFERLDMDNSFVRSLSEDKVWQLIDLELKSGKNIWRDLIQQFQLLDSPYATATAPSPGFLNAIEKDKQERLSEFSHVLMAQYHTSDEQEALSRFEQEDMLKTREVNRIEARVVRPRFTDHPPLTLDDDARYKQFRLGNVPVISTVFDHPPTIDIGLSFDLRKIPTRYYKYLPLLPKCLDSIGLIRAGQTTPYSTLLTQLQKEIDAFSIGYDVNPVSRRVDLTIRASTINAQEFRQALDLMGQIMQFNYLDVSNADRLRDLVARRISVDDLYTKQDGWITNPTYAFRYQHDLLYFAVNSYLTKAHWDERLKWLLHKQVSSEEIDKLGEYANSILSSFSSISRQELSQRFNVTEATDLNAELIEYWKRNLSSFPEAELINGLRKLTSEVQQDLRTGPTKAVADLKELQKMVLDRRALHVDLTLSQSMLDDIRPDLVKFLNSIPTHPLDQTERPADANVPNTISAKLEARYGSSGEQYPLYAGLVNSDGITGNVIFYSDFPDFRQLDRESLVQVLASKLLSGDGPQSIYAKTVETGLAYDDGIIGRPGLKILWFYANRIPDIPALMNLVNSVAAHLPDLSDPFLVDYVLRQTFSIPRSMSTFSQRGRALALDIRDGNTPEKIRRFSEAILRLRQEPDLLSELIRKGLASIGAVLLDEKYKEQQQAAKSLFFFAGPENVLSDIEHRLPIPKLPRLWPSDYWIE